MDLRQQLRDDLWDAMRRGEDRRKLAIRAVRAAITNAEVERRRSLTEDEILALIAREVKQRHDAILLFRKAEREDLVAKEQAEAEALERYLPRQFSTDDIQAEAQRVIAEVGATGPRDMGSVMRELMPAMRGRADGGQVGRIVRELLAARG